MKCTTETLHIKTPGRGFSDLTADIRGALKRAKVAEGIVTVFVRHTSASLVIQENADPSVRRDLERFMDKLAPEDSQAYEHDDEGVDDMPGHIRSAVTRTSETIPVVSGRLMLGTWQAVYLWEHRRAPHTREVVVTVLGNE